jgi:hypothetical protein
MTSLKDLVHFSKKENRSSKGTDVASPESIPIIVSPVGLKR